MLVERDQTGYYIGTVPELHGCHTQARLLDVLMRRAQEAIQLCLEAETSAGVEFIGLQRISVRR